MNDSMNKKINSDIIIYQTDDGSLELKTNREKNEILADINQIAQLFNRDKSVVSRHIKNIFLTKELQKNETIAVFATVQQEGNKSVKRNITYYNLDVILSVGYRINSKQANKFRQWSNKILKTYIHNGYVLDKKKIQDNYNNFINSVEDIKLLIGNSDLKNSDIINLIKSFANTWLSLNRYDKDELPTTGISKQKSIVITVNDFYKDLQIFKKELIKNGETTELFATEREKNGLENIFLNIFQSFDNIDVYSTIEEKAANLLYFIIKNHPFIDGNKRTGAYAFIWFLEKNNILCYNKINSQTLTVLTVLVAESNPKDKEKFIRLILQLIC